MLFSLPTLGESARDENSFSARASGREDGSSLTADFRHPATGKFTVDFHMDSESGLSGIKSLRNLRTGQVVSIDYVDSPAGKIIRRIAK